MNSPASGLAQRLDDAETLYRHGRLAEAEDVLRAVLDADSRSLAALTRLGVIRSRQGAYEDAMAFFRRALEQDPDSAKVHYGIGIALTALKRPDDAMASYRKALAIEPDFAEAYVNLANLLDGARQTEAAIACYRRAIEIEPDLVAAHRNLCITLWRSRKLSDAAEVARGWLKVEPGSEIAKFLLTLASGENLAARAPDGLLERMYDGYAANYDRHLQRLSYRAPMLVAGALARAGRGPQGQLAILDAGCGTGLCGALLRPYARRLTGIDLSSGMLEQAKATAVYDELCQAELVAYMNGEPESFDVVVVVDTLIYFGALDSVAKAAHVALRTGGLLVFTVEEAPQRDAERGYRLQAQGRYAHTRRYLRETLTAAGFGILAIETATHRMEAGKPVRGIVMTCERLPTPGMHASCSLRIRALRMTARRISAFFLRGEH